MIPDRILSKIDFGGKDGCWIWTGAIVGGGGYGATRWRKPDGTWGQPQVHRLLYKLTVENIPDHLTLDHLCRTPACVNPDHLEPVTNRTNILRGVGIAAVNARKTHCPRGHFLAGNNLRKGQGRRRRCAQCDKVSSRRRYLKSKEASSQ